MVEPIVSGVGLSHAEFVEAEASSAPAELDIDESRLGIDIMTLTESEERFPGARSRCDTEIERVRLVRQ